MTRFSANFWPGRAFGRHQSGTLRDRAVTARTMQRYSKILLLFTAFCTLNSVSISMYDLVAADLHAEAFLNNLYSIGAPRSYGTLFLSALAHRYPRLRRELGTAWRACKGWEREEPPKRAPPLPRSLFVLLTGELFFASHFRSAALCGLLFHCFLRPAEGLSLRRADISVSSDHAVLRLRHTKSGQRRLQEEFVTVEDLWVLFLLRLALRDMGDHPDALLSPWNYSELRAFMRNAVARHDLLSLGLVPYSFRRGGASWEFRQTRNFDRVMHRGRWQSLAAAKVYLTDAQAAAVSLTLPSHIRDLSNRVEDGLVDVFSQFSGVEPVGASLLLNGL